MDSIFQDLRYAARMLLKKPGFAVLAVMTLALGIGANTAIFSVVNAALLRGLPYPDSDRLVMLSTSNNEGVLGNAGFATFADWRERSQSFERMSVIRAGGGTLTGPGEPEVIRGLRVSADYFKMLGVGPVLGRDFRVEEDRPDSRFVVVISHSLWERRFNSDPSVIGKPLVLSDQTFTVVGVMPKSFMDFPAGNFYQGAEIWSPLGYDVAQSSACRTCQHLRAFGRLKPGVTPAQAQNEMSAIMKTMAQEHPKIYATPSVSVARLQDQFIGSIRPALYLLLAAVGLVLLIACVNIANLLLARSAERSREMAIRAALGAGRGRIVRQLLIESLMLSMLGAGVGLLLAMWGTELLAGLSQVKMLRLQPVETDLRVLSFTLLISLLTGLLFGLAPAWQAARQDLQLGLKESSKGSPGKGQRRLRELLVVMEVALALVLLIGAGLLIRSFTRVLAVAPGFESANLLTVPIRAVGAKYNEDKQVRSFTSELIKRIETLPGVEAAGFAGNLPLSGDYDSSGFHIEERPLPNPAEAPDAERYGVTPGYFRAMGIPILRGRGFTEQDGPETPLVALINETTARRLWPNEDPLGKRIRLGGSDSPLRIIVGVAGDVSHYGLEKPADLQAYVPHAQRTDAYLQLVVRTRTDPAALAGPVRQAIRGLDPDQPANRFKTMRELISDSVAERRFTLILIAAFAAIALLMASIGIYGVVAYLVSQRTQEIGIRMALGAQRRDVLALIVKQGMRWAAIGLAIGLIAAFALSRLLSGFLFGIRPTDPLTFFAIAFLLTIVALLACWIPARRAAKVDPMTALRDE